MAKTQRDTTRAPKKPVPIAEAVNLLGASDSTIRRWVREGCPHERVGTQIMLDLKAVRDWHTERRGTPDVTGRGRPSVLDTAPENVKEAIAVATLRKLVAQAERVEHDLAEKRGQVLPRAEVETGRLARIAFVRAGLLALPARLAQRCAGRDAVEVEREADEEVRKLLEGFSRE